VAPVRQVRAIGPAVVLGPGPGTVRPAAELGPEVAAVAVEITQVTVLAAEIARHPDRAATHSVARARSRALNGSRVAASRASVRCLPVGTRAEVARYHVPHRVAVVAAAAVGAKEKSMNRTSMGRISISFGLCAALAFSNVLQAESATYPSADAAATALVNALQANDDPALAKIFGADWKVYIPTGDIDRDDVDAFLASYRESHKIVEDGG
jgi:hypothetical protein